MNTEYSSIHALRNLFECHRHPFLLRTAAPTHKLGQCLAAHVALDCDLLSRFLLEVAIILPFLQTQTCRLSRVVWKVLHWLSLTLPSHHIFPYLTISYIVPWKNHIQANPPLNSFAPGSTALEYLKLSGLPKCASWIGVGPLPPKYGESSHNKLPWWCGCGSKFEYQQDPDLGMSIILSHTHVSLCSACIFQYVYQSSIFTSSTLWYWHHGHKVTRTNDWFILIHGIPRKLSPFQDQGSWIDQTLYTLSLCNQL